MESPSWPSTWRATGRHEWGESWGHRGHWLVWGPGPRPPFLQGSPSLSPLVPSRLGTHRPVVSAPGRSAGVCPLPWEPALSLHGMGHLALTAWAPSLEEPTWGLSSLLSGHPREGSEDQDVLFTDDLFQELRMEIAKQELIVHAREAASRVLSALSGVWLGPPSGSAGRLLGASPTVPLSLSQYRSADVRADGSGCPEARAVSEVERAVCEGPGGGWGAPSGSGGCVESGGPWRGFNQRGGVWGVVQRRRAARQEELDDDFSYARELRDREKRLKALEEQLERKAR